MTTFDLADYVLERPGQYDPWEDVRRRQGVELAWRNDVADPRFGNVLGLTNFTLLRIELTIGMGPQQTRCTLTHELLHLERGFFHPTHRSREESSINLIVAKRLVDPVLFDELMKRRDDPRPRDIYRFLNVDVRTFKRYASWRKRVKPSTATREWERNGLAKAWPVWPPKWLADNTAAMPEAAAYVGLA